MTSALRITTSHTLLLLALIGSLATPPAIAADTRNILVLYSNNRIVPGNIAVDRGLRSTLASSPERPLQIFSEFLDRPEFSGESYEKTMTTYLRDKYAERPPSMIIAVSDESFDFAMRHRGQLFPNLPLVYTAVSKTLLATLPRLPTDVVGVPVEYDYSGTIEQALRWQPNAERLVIVTGASQRDREREARLRREAPPLAHGLPIEFLAGLPTAAVLKRLGELSANSVVFTPGYFLDGDGRLFNPRDSAALMTAAATAPVYGPLDTFIGIGAVGGRTPSFEAMGRQAARIANELFAGAAPASLHLPDITPTVLRVDWRQIRRWGIDESRIPSDTVVEFKEPTFWEMYRNIAIAAIAVILLQAAVIVTFLIERRRRRTAEFAVQKQRAELAHASRLAVAGELTASIAHEINQPLGAVQTSADAADLLLHSGGERREDLQRIVTRIQRDIRRASDVIRRLRTLLAKHEPDWRQFDLNVALGDVENMLRAEALRRSVNLDFRPAARPALVEGDQTQAQQVLINLIINAMDACADMPEDRRTVAATIENTGDLVVVTVRDRGRGIGPEDMTRLFESFFSTKQKGMGLGLSIARTIVETHGGRIWAENGAKEGAVFHVTLPALDVARAASSVAT